jgi:hypothetical protein
MSTGAVGRRQMMVAFIRALMFPMAVLAGDLGRVNVPLRKEVQRCVPGGSGELSVRNLQAAVSLQLFCVESAIHRCSLFHAPRQHQHVYRGKLCGVINTGENIRSQTWKISVPRQFGLYIDFLQFHLPSSPGCEHCAHVTVTFDGQRDVVSYMYCGYRTPWYLGLLENKAVVTLKEGTRPPPIGFYFILTYYAFDYLAPSVSVQMLMETADSSKAGRMDLYKTLFINVDQSYKKLRVDLHFMIHAKVMDTIRLNYKKEFDVEVYDGPGPLSPLAENDIAPLQFAEERVYKRLSGYLCFIRSAVTANKKVWDSGFNRYSRNLNIRWQSVMITAPRECNATTAGVYNSSFGPCVIYEAFKLIVIHEMMFSGYTMMRYSSPSMRICQYGGLFVLMWHPTSHNFYEYTRLCGNVTQRSEFPYADYAEGGERLPQHHAYVMFRTFPGYSDGHIELEIPDKYPMEPEYVSSSVVIHTRANGRAYLFSVINEPQNQNVERQTVFTNVWIVNELHLAPSEPFENSTVYFSVSIKGAFPSGPFKMIAASSFMFERNALKVAMHSREHFSKPSEFHSPSISFSGDEYFLKSSVLVGFELSYFGYDPFPMFALHLQFLQESYYLCLPGKGFGVHERTEAGRTINVQVPNAWPEEQFADTKLWWNYRSGGCRATFIDRSNCSTSKLTKLAEIHFRANIYMNLAFEVDVSIRKTPLCSLDCALNVAIWEFQMSGEGPRRYSEFRNVYRITWQLIRASFRISEMHLHTNCSELCAKRCDVAVAVKLPLTSNHLHTKRSMYVKYVDYVKNNIGYLFGPGSLIGQIDKFIGNKEFPRYRHGSWYDAHAYCQNRNLTLYPLTRTLHGRLWELAHSAPLALGWTPSEERFFADMRYDADVST